MNNVTKKLLITAELLWSLNLFSSCAGTSECDYPTLHAHKYTKAFGNGKYIYTYFVSEDLSHSGYDWNEEYMEVTEDDVEFYKFLDKHDLFYGRSNWWYLFNKMKNNHDYIRYWYHDEYTRLVAHEEVDSKGNVSTYYTTETVVDEGWSSNPNHAHNTGKIRLYHHKYCGYKVVVENGELTLKRSPYVDDIRDIIDDYPYFEEDCVDEVYVEYKFKPSELPNIKPSDFDTFRQPDLSNPELSSKQMVMELTM